MTTLNAIQLRVLGSLLEKSLAQPEYYPMTTNALVAACNQKSNRDPVMSLDEDSVWNALEALRGLNLVTKLLPGGASRVERYKHEVKQTLGWEKPQWPVMAELILRGPQTQGELRSHCARLFPYENSEALGAVVENLMRTDPPLVAMLPRAPGQAAVRYMHLLGRDRPSAAAFETHTPAGNVASTESASARLPTSAAAQSPQLAAPAAVEALRRELAELRDELNQLKAAVAPLIEHLR